MHCKFTVAINFRRAQIAALNMQGTHIGALFADGLKLNGNVFLWKGFRTQGTVSFLGATIDKYFCITHVRSPEQMTLDLSSAKIGTIYDDKESWPYLGRLFLHGLEYAEFFHESPRDSKSRIEWLRRQKNFRPQPYEQLAEVLRNNSRTLLIWFWIETSLGWILTTLFLVALTGLVRT